MAPLTLPDFDMIARANDVPYCWPKQTCGQIFFDIVERVSGKCPGKDIPLPDVFALGESRASLFILRNCQGRWLVHGRNWLLEHGVARDVTDGSMMLGDLVEFNSPHLQIPNQFGGMFIGTTGVVRVSPTSETWIYAPTVSGIVPIPAKGISVRIHMRAMSCLQ